jgi:hypothetical protein
MTVPPTRLRPVDWGLGLSYGAPPTSDVGTANLQSDAGSIQCVDAMDRPHALRIVWLLGSEILGNTGFLCRQAALRVWAGVPRSNIINVSSRAEPDFSAMRVCIFFP